MNKLLVLDFESQFTGNVTLVLEQLNINYDLVKHDYDFSLLNGDVKGIIITGSHDTVYDDGRRCDSRLFRCGRPVLGICYGHQLTNDDFNGTVARAIVPEMDIQKKITIDVDNPIFDGMNKLQNVSMFHNDEVIELGDGFIGIAHGDDCKYAASYNKEYQIYTLQFHPECDKYSDYSKEYFINFAKICGII